MDDLTDQLNELLSSPQAMEQIQSLASMLMGSADGAEGEEKPAKQEASPLDGLLDPAMLLKAAPLVSKLSAKDDPDTLLLTALRPYLREERQKRLDTAQRLLKIGRMLPVLKESGLLNQLF
ncbi:MAG: hypothetical protein HFE85_03565 [Clostridiales bacterium]|nr:hypothetical protein [Clostridiales bacterium]